MIRLGIKANGKYESLEKLRRLDKLTKKMKKIICELPAGIETELVEYKLNNHPKETNDVYYVSADFVHLSCETCSEIYERVKKSVKQRIQGCKKDNGEDIEVAYPVQLFPCKKGDQGYIDGYNSWRIEITYKIVKHSSITEK